MRRWRILLTVLLLMAPMSAHAISDPSEKLANPAEEARAERVGSQLRCLVCQNESIEDSGADLARDLRKIVRQRVQAGDTDAQIIAWMTARYGDFVRLRPPFNALTALLWASPVLAVGAGVAAAFAGRASRRHQPDAPPPLDPVEAARLKALLDQ